MVGAAGLSALLPGCRVGYVLRSGWFQAELLASRVPVERLEARGALTDEQAGALATVSEVKAWGRSIGLAATDSYESVAWGWDRTIWNLTGCDPVSFTPATWWFPIVGRVPYLGFFTEEEARAEQAALDALGMDTWLRTAGAYSTLGWFRDPILPGMLAWDERSLANTILHEMVHATVWIPGSVGFNESFASFVGDEAGLRYLVQRHGPDSPIVGDARRRDRDRVLWVALQQGLYEDLEAVYANPTLTDEEKLAAKAVLVAEVPARARAAGFEDPAPYLRAADLGPWNNARLAQFRTYNDGKALFQALLDAEHGDLLAFLERVRATVAGHEEPFEALRDAVAGLP